MQIELTAEELERILIALKEHVQHQRSEGLPVTQLEELIARLELAERDFRRAAGAAT